MMNSLPSISSLSARLQPLSAQRLRHEMLSSYVHAALRREALVLYMVRLAGLGLLVLLGAFLIQLMSVFGAPVVLSPRDADVAWILSVAVAAAATLIAGVNWWRSRVERVRSDLRALQLRLVLDEHGGVEERDPS